MVERRTRRTLNDRCRTTALAVSGICGSRGSPGSCQRGPGVLAQPLTEVAAVADVADPTSFLTRAGNGGRRAPLPLSRRGIRAARGHSRNLPRV
jgi:hypothetical protein